MDCDLCREPVRQRLYTIPLDPQWERFSGVYCSRKCALWSNSHVCKNQRPLEGWEMREEWFQIRFPEGGVDKFQK